MHRVRSREGGMLWLPGCKHCSYKTKSSGKLNSARVQQLNKAPCHKKDDNRASSLPDWIFFLLVQQCHWLNGAQPRYLSGAGGLRDSALHYDSCPALVAPPGPLHLRHHPGYCLCVPLRSSEDAFCPHFTRLSVCLFSPSSLSLPLYLSLPPSALLPVQSEESCPFASIAPAHILCTNFCSKAQSLFLR